MSDKVAILFIIDCILGIGGTEKHLAQLATLLSREGFRCSVVVFDLVANSLVDTMRAAGVQVHHVPLGRIYTLSALRRARELVEIIKRDEINLVQTFHQKSDTFGAIVAKVCGVKHIISSKRDVGLFKRSWHVFLNRQLKSLFERTIVVSDAVAESIMINEGIDRSRIIKIYNGVDTKQFSPPSASEAVEARARLGLSQSDFVAGMVAKFSHYKNHRLFFEGAIMAMRQIPSLKIVTVGSGSLLEQYRALYHSSEELRSRIIFVGAVENVNHYLRAMDVGCLLGNEGFSNAVLEKMATGLPMIVEGIGGNAEAVINGKNGFVIPPSDADALCAALVRLHGDTTTRLEMGRWSRRLVEEKYDLHDMLERHRRLYLSVCRESG